METELQTNIAALELKQRTEGQQLKEHFQTTYESLQPINVIRRTVSEVVRSHELRDQLIGTAMGLAAGYIAKMLFERGKDGPVVHILGTALQFGITTAVLKNPEFLAMVGHALTGLFAKRETNDETPTGSGAQLGPSPTR
jgi:hypothetical protein